MQTSSSAPDLLRAAVGTERETPPVPAALAPHFPDFEISGLLGQGGMGAVYRARRRADGAVFALKVVVPKSGHDNAFAARFAREAEALARLHHPNIVAIHGHGNADGWCWLLMDLVEGANLREIVATGRLSPAQTLALVAPLCAALQYAHDQGVVHRDLKPENILLDAAGVPHLVDFGLAKLRDGNSGNALTNTGAAMGTVHYMAPEQVASAKGVDHRADIYALGVVIYELLTGQLPLGRFENPSQRVQVDVRIDEVVLKALERDPERRWQQMRLVGKAVADIKAPPVPSSVWRRVNRAGVIAAVLYAVVAGLALVFPQTDLTWHFATLATLALVLSGWIVATLIYQGRTRTLWLMTGVLITGCLTSVALALERQSRNPATVIIDQPVEKLKPLIAESVKPPERPVVTLSDDLTTTERATFQAKLKERLTVNYEKSLISDILNQVCAVSGFDFLLRDQDLEKMTLTVHMKDGTIEDLLRALVTQNKLRLTYTGNILMVDTEADPAWQAQTPLPPKKMTPPL